MGGYDHPTTGRPSDIRRFGSSLCYPDPQPGEGFGRREAEAFKHRKETDPDSD